MVKLIIVIVTISGMIYLFHKICLWLETKGYLYYKNKKADSGFLAGTLETINGILNPAVRHTIHMKQNNASSATIDKQKAEDDDNKNNDQGKRYN